MENPILINIYNNIYNFIEKNKLQPLDTKIENNSDFYNIINQDKYITIKTISNIITKEEKEELNKILKIISSYNKNIFSIKDIEKKYNINLNNIPKITYILLLHNEGEYESKSINFKNLINSIKYPYTTIITISKEVLSTHVHKQLVELSNEKRKIFNYSYDKFKFIVNNHVLCSPHTILNSEEEEYLLNKILKIKKCNLPKIKLNDPQVIWIGGEIGNIVRIDRDSEITGKSIYYRVIIN